MTIMVVSDDDDDNEVMMMIMVVSDEMTTTTTTTTMVVVVMVVSIFIAFGSIDQIVSAHRKSLFKNNLTDTPHNPILDSQFRIFLRQYSRRGDRPHYISKDLECPQPPKKKQQQSNSNN